MRQKSRPAKEPAEKVVKDVRRVTRRQFSAEEKIRIVLEGPHRDGVDWVLVMLVNRKNVESGVTSIYGLDHSHLGDFTLTDPLDAVFLQDPRVFHGVTATARWSPIRSRAAMSRSSPFAQRPCVCRARLVL